MSDMRRRDGKLKVLHTIIGDFGKTLRNVAELEEVDAILTGTISPSKSYKETLTFQYFTDNGLKLLAKTTTAVQEIFIVTASPELLLDEMTKSGFLYEERTDVKHFKKNKHHNHAKHADFADANEEQAPLAKNPTRKRAPNTTSEEDPLTLRQMLPKDQLSALMKLKEQVTKSSTPTKTAKPDTSKRKQKQKQTSDEDDFASLFAPKEDDESFEDMLNRSKLDPKFFK